MSGAAVAMRSRADCSSMEDRRGNKRPYQPKHSPSLHHNKVLQNKDQVFVNKVLPCLGFRCNGRDL